MPKTAKAKGDWRLINEPRNLHYKRASQDSYEAVAQHCWYVAGPEGDSDFVADIITVPVDAGGDKVARAMAAASRLMKALQRMLDESNGRGISNQAKVEARAALQSARGSA